MEVVPNSGQQISSKEDYVKELARWEQHHTEFTPRGTKPGNPYTKREFPMMIYCARQEPNTGKWVTAVQVPKAFGYRDQNEWDLACQMAYEFTRSCQRIVHNESELDAAMKSGEGWQPSAPEALAWRQKLEDEISTAAAERNYRDRNMGERAKKESAQAEADHFGHLPELPEKPIKRRGRVVRAAA